jgi:hypothetical protein
MWSSGTWRHAALIRTTVSKKRIASIITVTRICDLGKTLTVTSNRSMLRRNTILYIPKKFQFLQEPHGVTSQKTVFSIFIKFSKLCSIQVQKSFWFDLLISFGRRSVTSFRILLSSREEFTELIKQSNDSNLHVPEVETWMAECRRPLRLRTFRNVLSTHRYCSRRGGMGVQCARFDNLKRQRFWIPYFAVAKRRKTASVVYWSEFQAANPEVPSSISNATRFSE